MDTNDAARVIDDLVDEGAGIVIEAGGLDAAFADRLAAHLQAWRSLAQRGFGVSEDGLEALNRHLERTGE